LVSTGQVRNCRRQSLRSCTLNHSARCQAPARWCYRAHGAPSSRSDDGAVSESKPATFFTSAAHSVLGGDRARVPRHFRWRKPCHCHIEYLGARTQPVAALCSYNFKPLENLWAQGLPADFTVVSGWPRRQRSAKLELSVNGAKVSLAYDVADTRNRPPGAFKC
jgi:Uri superfamily endonuclease